MNKKLRDREERKGMIQYIRSQNSRRIEWKNLERGNKKTSDQNLPESKELD